jgi:hypothetical protein
VSLHGSVGAMNLSDEERKRRIKDILLAVSLANLYFLNKWAEYFHMPNEYYRKFPYTWTNYSGILLNTLILSLIFWFGKRLTWQSKSTVLQAIGRVVFLAVLLVPLNVFRSKLDLRVSRLMPYTPWLVAGGLAGLAALARWHRAITRAVATLVLILFPFFLFNMAHVGWEMAKLAFGKPEEGDGRLAPFFATKAGAPRVVWIILDELDQRVAFLERPPGLELPELDRLRREGVFAERAEPPGYATLISMPALIVGRDLSAVAPSGRRDLDITFQDTHQSTNWSSQPNVFSQARAAGFNTGLVGWYHPYGRILASSLNRCEWQAYPPNDQRWGSDLFSVMENQVLAGWPIQNRRLHRLVYLKTLADARQLVADSRLGLVLCHLPVPHYPGIYDRRKQRFTLTNFDVAESYLANLVVADGALGELRQSLATSGTEKTTTILLSSDHWWRESATLDGKLDKHVPFLLKLPGDQQAIHYAPVFNTVLTRDLILAILRGEISSHAEAVRCIDQQRSTTP